MLKASDVMRTDLRWVSPDTYVVDLERMLLAEGIGAVPVVKDGKLVGIVSRSDVVRQLAVEQTLQETISDFYRQPFDVEQRSAQDSKDIAAGVASRWQDLAVEDVMIRGVICVEPDRDLVDVARMMLDRKIHRVLVTEGDRLVGIVSTVDLIRLFAEGKLVAA